MNVKIIQLNNTTQFQGSTSTGQTIQFHAPHGDDEKVAPSPMEALLMAAASCSSVDVILILEKMKQKLTLLEVNINAERTPRGNSKPFSAIQMNFELTGNIDQKKAERAVKLSVEKYCSVVDSLDPMIAVDWTVLIK